MGVWKYCNNISERTQVQRGVGLLESLLGDVTLSCIRPLSPLPCHFPSFSYFFAFLLIGICGSTGNLLIVFRGKAFIVMGTTGTIINVSIYSVRNPECKSNIQLDFLSSQ